MKYLKKIGVAVSLLSALTLGACSSSDSESNAANESKEQVKKVLVGTGTQFPNICFLDDKGNLTGYDVELVREIDEKLEDYEFEFKTMEFSNLLMSLETNKIDMIAHQMEVNEERQEKFLFNKEPYNVFPLKVTVNENNKDIKSVDDLKGKKVGVTPTSNSAVFIKEYSEKHDLNVDILYSTNSTDVNQRLKEGRIDATITTPFAVKYLNEQSDAGQKVVGDALLSSKVYFLFNKEQQALSDAIDGALKELKAEGEISKLSKKWLGDDYSVDF